VRLSLAFLAIGVLAAPLAAQRSIVVSPTGSVRSVQAAVRMASRHDVILVEKGVYRERATIVVDKPLTLIGKGWPVLDGQNARQIMVVTADSVTVRGFQFAHVGSSFLEDWAALRVDDATGCRITGNRFEDSFFGIYLSSVTDCVVSGNVLRSARLTESLSGNGIHLWQSTHMTIEDNSITGHRDGIYFEFVHHTTIRRNLSEGNLRYGLHFMYSDDCRYIDNIFRGNGSGVAVMYTNRVEMTGNRFEGNWGGAAYGLLLKEISDGKLTGNVFLRNTTALLADGANRLQAHRNDFINNGWAVKLAASTQDARFTGNNYIGNSFDVSSNSSSEQTTTFTGNYWDSYEGYDLNRDGYGDVPFRPVRLFSAIVEKNAPVIILLRSPFVRLLDSAERLLPLFTPAALADSRPAMARVTR
jgi:nitrous oxidase accessory protein